MPATEPADLSLDTTLFMGPLLAREAKRRLEPVMRTQPDEPIGLDPAATLQHPDDRAFEVVVADQVKDAAMPFQRADVPLQERLLRLIPERDHERGTRETRPHLEQMHHHRLTPQEDRRLPPIDLRLVAGVADQRHERLADITQLAALVMHIATDLPLRHRGAVLLNEALPDPPGGMTLLPRRLTVREQDLVDHLPIRSQLRCRPDLRRALRRRDRGLQRLPDRPAMHPVALRQLADRQLLPRVIAPDLLELLHPRHCSFRTFRSRSTKREPNGSGRTEVGPVQASTVGPVPTSTPTE